MKALFALEAYKAWILAKVRNYKKKHFSVFKAIVLR